MNQNTTLVQLSTVKLTRKWQKIIEMLTRKVSFQSIRIISHALIYNFSFPFQMSQFFFGMTNVLNPMIKRNKKSLKIK